MLRKNTIAFFNFVIDMISTLIDQCLNRSRENGASDEDYGITYHPYGIDKELAKPSDLDDYSFNEILDNSVSHTTLVREKRARKVDDEMSASVAVIARSMHREMSLMDEMNAHEELMSRKESEDAFFNHHYISPKIIDSKIITRNINALYIGKKPMTNRPVTRTRRRQRAVFHFAMPHRRSLLPPIRPRHRHGWSPPQELPTHMPHSNIGLDYVSNFAYYGVPHKDVSMVTYRREESPRFLGGFLYICANFAPRTVRLPETL